MSLFSARMSTGELRGATPSNSYAAGSGFAGGTARGPRTRHHLVETYATFWRWLAASGQSKALPLPAPSTPVMGGHVIRGISG